MAPGADQNFSIAEIQSIQGAPFEIRQISEVKGQGIIAISKIPKSSVVFREKAIFMHQNGVLGQKLNDDIKGKLRNSNAGAEKQFLSLHNRYSDQYLYAGIFLTNAFRRDDDDENDDDDSGEVDNNEKGQKERNNIGIVFPTISRFNHSCRPNCFQGKDEKGAEWGRVVAVRDILPGEELVINYESPLATFVERYDSLKMQYDFICDCDVCVSPFEEIYQSDARRSAIQSLANAMQTAGMLENAILLITQPTLLLKDCRRLVELIKEEFGQNLVVHASGAYLIGATISLYFGDAARMSVFSARRFELVEAFRPEGIAKDELRWRDDPEMVDEFGALPFWRTKLEDIPVGLSESSFEKWLWQHAEK